MARYKCEVCGRVMVEDEHVKEGEGIDAWERLICIPCKHENPELRVHVHNEEKKEITQND